MDDETKAREIAHTATGCCLTARLTGPHSPICDSVTEAILAFGQEATEGEREACAEVAEDRARFLRRAVKQRLPIIPSPIVAGEHATALDAIATAIRQRAKKGNS